MLIPSAQPSRGKTDIPTVIPSGKTQGDKYAQRLSQTLNDWAKGSPFVVEGKWFPSSKLGVGMAVLQKTLPGRKVPNSTEDFEDVLTALHNLREISGQKLNTFELIRGAKVFDRDRLFLVKPIAQRFWTETAALNDADEIAGTILMQRSREKAWQ